MASDHYKQAIDELQNYFGISYVCSQYLYHRAIRSRRVDNKYLPWTIQLQNALVKADKCLGINWDRVFFGSEEQNLLVHGINIKDMPNNVFRWNTEILLKQQESQNSEWITVSNKRKKKEKGLLASKVGIFT